MAIGSSLNKLFSTAGTSKPQTGTGYTNLNKFLGANQGNQLGQKVAGSLQTQIGGVKSQLGEQQTAFQTEADKNKLNTEENTQKRDEVIGRFSNASSAGGPLSDEDVSKVTQYRGGAYTGPTGLKDTSALSQQATDLAGQTTNLSPSGTQELLRRTIGGGRYTQGQQKLDSLLMDRSGLKQVGREAQTLGSDVNRANLAAQGQAQALKGQAAQFGQETTEKLQGALTGLDTAAQEQLTAAQASENDRLARIQAIQDFAAGKVAKKDEAGNTLKDQYGNILYDTVNPRGTTDSAGQLDYLKNLLSSQGVDQTEIDSLLGAGNFTQGQSQYNQQIGNINQSQLGESAYNIIQRNMNNNLHNLGSEYYTETSPDPDGYTNKIVNMDKVRQDLINGRLDPNSLKMDQNSEGDSPWNLGEIAQRENYTLNSTYNPQRQAAAQDFYGSRGLAGQALQGGNLDSLYTNLGRAIGNSQAAQNLTVQGVASEPIRNNYTALQQLLGQSPDMNKYSGDANYQAGNLLLNPDQIKRALGY